MNHPKLVQFICSIVALLLLCGAASAQVGALRGRVLFRQADGTTIPVSGAAIDVFRVDLMGRFNTKTDDKGEFVFAGLPYVGFYLIAASSPNAKPQVIANVKAGRDVEYELVLEPGDGTRLTREEAEATLNAAPPADTATEIHDRKFRLGNEALRQNLYDEAIKLYDEGLAAVPEEPVLMIQKSSVLMRRGVEKYNTAISTHIETERSAKMKSASQDFRDAAEVVTTAVELIKAEPIPAEERLRENRQKIKVSALRARAEAMRLLVTKVDPAQAAVGLTAFQEYIDAEDDQGLRSRAELNAARMLLDAKSTKSAIEQYRHILVSDPQNMEANFGYGFALYQSGEKDRFQEAARYLQFFLEHASESDPLKQVAAETLEKLRALR